MIPDLAPYVERILVLLTLAVSFRALFRFSCFSVCCVF